VLREYPKGLGKALLSIWKDHKIPHVPLPCLRQKYEIPFESDLALFSNLELGDTWPDAKLVDCYLYLYKNKKLALPEEWRPIMKDFTKQLKAVPRMNVFFATAPLAAFKLYMSKKGIAMYSQPFA